MKKIKSIITETKNNKGLEKNYYLIFWPKRSTLCKESLEKDGVLI